MPIGLDAIRTKFKERKEETKFVFADEKFYLYLSDCHEIAAIAMRAKVPKRPFLSSKLHADIIASNFVVNCVTALEVYFKEVIIQNSHWDDKGLTALLKEKLTLGEAYEMFNKEKITREYIVSHFYSFQNLEAISATFSKLTDCDFFREIENYPVDLSNEDGPPMSLLDEHPNWRKELALLYDVRNRYVHDGVMEKLKIKDIESLFSLVFTFQFNIDEWLERKYAMVAQHT